jgi:hypothetical protein
VELYLLVEEMMAQPLGPPDVCGGILGGFGRN